jgi:Spy/CpxP family protein refolding chaperone
MMSWLICVLVLSGVAYAQGAGQPKRSVYAGDERREIKALADEEVEALLSGQGMGLAKAAELNHYPGPRHVLELANELELSPEQRTQTQVVLARMRGEATALGRRIVERERALDADFAKGDIDAARLRAATTEIARLQGELRAAHLAAHLEMRRLLSPRQIAKYDALRGYASGQQTGEGHVHGHGKH